MIAKFIEIVATIAMVATVAMLIARWRAQRAVPAGLYLIVAFASTAWMEPFYDWGLYARFSTDFIRVHTGYLDLAGNGLPIVALPLYGVYFYIAGVCGVALGNRLARWAGWARPLALLVCGYAVGAVWDLAVEIFGTRTNLWEFTHVARGFVPFGGTSNQIPLGMPLGMGAAIMVATYLLGCTGGELVTKRWGRRLAGRSRETARTLLVTVLAFQIVMATALVPFVITRAAGWNTVVDPAFGSSAGGSPVGTLFFVVFFALFAAALTAAVRCWDPEMHEPAREVTADRGLIRLPASPP